MNCPGSVRACEGISDTSSVFANEGTAAHELADNCLKHGFDADRFIGETIVVKNDVFTVDEEMADAVQVYLDHVRGLVSPGDELMVEQGFDLSFVQEGMYGTNDASVYRRATRELHVIDYKHGKGVAVDVDDNPQLKYYALGAVGGRAVDKVVITVVQPRAQHRDGPVRSQEIELIDLVEFVNELKTAALATAEPNAPLVPGDWCKFCPRAGSCDALHKRALEIAQLDFEPQHMSASEIAAVLNEASLVENWIRGVWAYAQSIVDTGGELPGWKLVRGRANRRWALDPEALEAKLQARYQLNEGDIFAPRKLKTPAQIEKLLPKDMRAAFSDELTEKPEGKATLARIQDPRAEIGGGQSAAREFDVIHDEMLL